MGLLADDVEVADEVADEAASDAERSRSSRCSEGSARRLDLGFKSFEVGGKISSVVSRFAVTARWFNVRINLPKSLATFSAVGTVLKRASMVG